MRRDVTNGAGGVDLAELKQPVEHRTILPHIEAL